MGEEQDNGFVRQRRNLMVISLVLLFSEVADLKVTKLSAFGNDLLIGKPVAVSVALWIAGFYWLLRFYQYSRPYMNSAVRDTLFNRVQVIAPVTAMEIALRQNPDLRARIPGIDADPEISLTSYTYKGQWWDRLEVNVKLSKAASTGSKATAQGLGEFDVRIQGADLRRLRFRSWFYLALHTKVFTDFMLPYVLFGLPLIYVAFGHLRHVF